MAHEVGIPMTELVYLKFLLHIYNFMVPFKNKKENN